MILGIAAGAYAAVVFVPVWVLNYEVKQVVRDYGNQAIKNSDDAVLLDGMVKKIRTLQQVAGIDEAGRKVMVPVIDVQKQDVTWERSADPLSLHVELRVPARPRAALAGEDHRADVPGEPDHGSEEGRLGPGEVTARGRGTT